VCEAVREDERLAHTLEGEEPGLGIVLPGCEEYFCGDTGTEGSDELKDIVLPRRVRKEERKVENVKLRGLRFGRASPWGR